MKWSETEMKTISNIFKNFVLEKISKKQKPASKESF